MVRVTVAEAARRLGISEAGVRKRIQRGQIPHERGADSRTWVWVSPGEVRHAESRDKPDQSRDELVDELRDQVRYLRQQLADEREARTEERRRHDTVIAQLSAANAEQARTIRAIEASSSQGGSEPPQNATVEPVEPSPSEPPEMADDEQQGRGPIPDAGDPQSGPERRWWEFWR
jgi:hypothetical protein